MAGILVALASIVVAARPRKEYDHDEPSGSHLPSIALATVAAVCFGLFVVAIKGASQGGALWAVMLSRLTTVTVLMIALPLMTGGQRGFSFGWLRSVRLGSTLFRPTCRRC